VLFEQVRWWWTKPHRHSAVKKHWEEILTLAGRFQQGQVEVEIKEKGAKRNKRSSKKNRRLRVKPVAQAEGGDAASDVVAESADNKRGGKLHTHDSAIVLIEKGNNHHHGHRRYSRHDSDSGIESTSDTLSDRSAASPLPLSSDDQFASPVIRSVQSNLRIDSSNSISDDQLSDLDIEDDDGQDENHPLPSPYTSCCHSHSHDGHDENNDFAHDNSWSGPILRSLQVVGRFVNPWPEWEDRNTGDFAAVLWWQLTRKCRNGIPKEQTVIDDTLPVQKPNFELLESFHQLSQQATLEQNPNPPVMSCTWFGQSTCFVQMDGYNILTDPIFSTRTVGDWFGPKRIQKVPCQLEDLPKIDIVLVSHNHFDHLGMFSKFCPCSSWAIRLGCLLTWLFRCLL
jgi:hypothetical protein